MNATIQDKSQASPRLLSPSTYSIAEFIEKINPKDENFFKYIPNSFLNEEQKQAKAKALARELKISQKEKILPTVTPQDAFVDILKDPSINSIPENIKKVNTSDEKNSKPLNDEAPIGAGNNEKHSQDELRATLEAKVANVVGGHVVYNESEERAPKKENGALDKSASEDRNKIISDTIDKALLNKGNINEKYNQKKISLVPEEIAKYVLQASAGQIDIFQKYIAINGDNIWHEYKSHQNEIKENSLKQIPLSPEDIKEAISAIYNPDIVESIFSDINNPTQRQSFVFAKKSTKGHYVVVEAIGGKNNPNIVPVMILQFNEEKLNEMFNFDKTFGELFFDNDTKKLNALNTKLNKENRVIVAQFVSTETIANTPRSPRFTNIISHNDEKINTSDEKILNSLNDEDPPIADNNKKHNAKILKQKEDVAQSNPQLYEWLRIINAPSSINSITQNSEKVNTLDGKNSKQLNDEDPPIADNNKKNSQDELRATLEAKVLAQEKKRVAMVKC